MHVPASRGIVNDILPTNEITRLYECISRKVSVIIEE